MGVSWSVKREFSPWGAQRGQKEQYMPQEGQQSTKKPYTTPTLTTYGDVRKLTESHGFGTVADAKKAKTF